jgi:metal-sulfur cluster biosynthetic enzyme
MSVVATTVLDALRSVTEPCSILMRRPMSIVDMGLIESVEIEGGHVHVTLVLTDASCVHFTSMQRYIREVLLELEAVDEVTVGMSVTQLWTPDRMTAEFS